MTTLQKPIGSGFGAASTGADVIKSLDLSGRVAIVTGGYSGIGLETARVLRSAGAKVIVPTCDHDKAVRALQGLDVEIEALDLLDPALDRRLRRKVSCLLQAARRANVP